MKKFILASILMMAASCTTSNLKVPYSYNDGSSSLKIVNVSFKKTANTFEMSFILEKISKNEFSSSHKGTSKLESFL